MREPGGGKRSLNPHPKSLARFRPPHEGEAERELCDSVNHRFLSLPVGPRLRRVSRVWRIPLLLLARRYRGASLTGSPTGRYQQGPAAQICVDKQGIAGSVAVSKFAIYPISGSWRTSKPKRH